MNFDKCWINAGLFKNINHFPPSVPIYMAPFSKNFELNLRKNHQKNFLQRRDYESVDKVAYVRVCHKKRQKKILVEKGHLHLI